MDYLLIVLIAYAVVTGILIAALSIGYLRQQTQIANQERQITLNMQALNKAANALKGKTNGS